MLNLDKYPLLRAVIDILRNNRIEAYLVGGAVRDLLLERNEIVDFDFAVPEGGLKVARQVADRLQAAFYPLDVQRGTGRVVIEEVNGDQKRYLDFATFRGPTLLDDLSDRDFTINAMALSLTDPPQLLDPLQGQRDLRLGQIRAVNEQTFQQDPIRLLRAGRQATEFGFAIEAHTEQSMGQAADGLARVSPERQRDELLKLLNTCDAGQAVAYLHRLGILVHLLPEVEALVGVEQSLPHHLDVFKHTTTVLSVWGQMCQAGFPQVPARWQPNMTDYLGQPLAGDLTIQRVMPLALLLHDTGKPLTRSEVPADDRHEQRRVAFIGHEKKSAKIARRILARLHFSSQAAGFVETVVAQHMRPLSLAQAGSISRRAIYRLFRDTSGHGYQAGLAVALHALADHQATYPPEQGHNEMQALLKVFDKLAEAYFEQHHQLVDPPPLLTGHDLMERFNLGQGRLIGLLLKRLKEAQASGQVENEAAALAFIQADPDFIAYYAEEK